MDNDDLYKAFSKIMQKLSDLEARNLRLEEFISNNFASFQTPQPVVVEERTEPDERNISASKKTMTPEGSLITVTSKPICVSGRHIITQDYFIVFCSACGRTICKKHAVGSSPLCAECALKEINMDEEEIYVLCSIVYGTPLNYEVSDYATIIDRLEAKGYVKRKFLFKIKPTIKGVHAINLFDELINSHGREHNSGEDKSSE
ncbi:MAG: hypothetical protein QXZ59_06275, partial [Nitrososphaeria archaeon]